MHKLHLEAKQRAVQLLSLEFCSTSNNELMWIWLITFTLEKNKSILINRCIHMDVGIFRAKLEERLETGQQACSH